MGRGCFHGLNQRLPRVRRGRAIATFHDLFVMTGEYSTPEFRARFTAQAREAAARADAIIAVSAFTKRQVVELLGVDPARVHVIHHGVRPLPYRAAAAREGGAERRRDPDAQEHRAAGGGVRDAAMRRGGWCWRARSATGRRRFGSASSSSAARDRIAVLGYVTPPELDGLVRAGVDLRVPVARRGLRDAAAGGDGGAGPDRHVEHVGVARGGGRRGAAGGPAGYGRPWPGRSDGWRRIGSSDGNWSDRGEARVREFRWEKAVRRDVGGVPGRCGQIA